MVRKHLNKEAQLGQTIDLILDKYEDRVQVKDFWDSDLCAIGFCDRNEKYLIYISTFGLPAQRFNIILENLSDQTIVGEFNEITFDRLENILIDHLKIK